MAETEKKKPAVAEEYTLLEPVVLCGIEYAKGDKVKVAAEHLDALKKLGCI